MPTIKHKHIGVKNLRKAIQSHEQQEYVWMQSWNCVAYRMSMHHGNLFPQQDISNNWQCGKYSGQDVLIIHGLNRKVVNLKQNSKQWNKQ